MVIVDVFGENFAAPDRDWKWLTVDADGTVTIFENDPSDDFGGEPTIQESTFSSGYWAYPYGSPKGWYELTIIDRPKNWKEELYHLDLEE